MLCNLGCSFTRAFADSFEKVSDDLKICGALCEPAYFDPYMPNLRTMTAISSPL
jgi:hypothetical protein